MTKIQIQLYMSLGHDLFGEVVDHLLTTLLPVFRRALPVYKICFHNIHQVTGI